MLLGSIKTKHTPTLLLNGQAIDRVSSYKLLGLHVTDTLRWNDHVSSICTKAAQRLHFLKQLKHAGMSAADLLYFYQTVIRPVAEYACVVWHSSLTKGQTNELESIQRRAMKIIFSYKSDNMVDALNTLPSLCERRDQLTKQFFTNLLTPSSYLHHIIPEKRSDDITSRLRNAKQYYTSLARSERYKNSPITYAFNHYF